MEDIVIIGASGFGRGVAWLIEEINGANHQWNILGFIDDDESIQGKKISKYNVIGKTEDLLNKELNVVIAVANPKIRQKIYKRLENTKNNFPNLIHPSVIKSDSVKLGQGVIIAAGAILTIDIIVNDFVIVDRGCNIGHDTKINCFSTVSISTTLSGNVHIKESVFIGAGVTVIQELTLEKNSVIGAGAVVTKDIPKNCTAVGVPAKPINFHENIQ